MAITLVSGGTVATIAGTSVTPSFGQATTAGNHLFAFVQSVGSATTTAPGWTVLQDSGSQCTIAYKFSCGASETAPTFTFAGNGTNPIAAVLAEFSSGARTTLVLDQHTGANTGLTFASIVCSSTLPAVDATETELVLFGTVDNINRSTTVTASATTWSGGTTSGTAGRIANNGSTKQAWHLFSDYHINTAGGAAADSVSVTLTPASGTGAGYWQMASFQVVTTPPPIRVINFGALGRAANW